MRPSRRLLCSLLNAARFASPRNIPLYTTHLWQGDQNAVAFLTFSPEELTAIRLSLRVGFWAMLGSLPVALIVAMLLARGRFWGAACSTSSSICRW